MFYFIFIIILNYDFIYRKFFIFSYYFTKVILVYEKFWLKKKKKLIWKFLKVSRFLLNVLNLLRLFGNLKFTKRYVIVKLKK